MNTTPKNVLAASGVGRRLGGKNRRKPTDVVVTVTVPADTTAVNFCFKTPRLTQQQVINAMRDRNLLTDVAYVRLLNGDAIPATLEFLTQIINYAAVPALTHPEED